MSDLEPYAREIRSACLALHLQRAARAASRAYDAALKPVGLTSGQFTFLVSLAGPTSPELPALARELAMDRTTLIANTKPLERRGLVTSVFDGKRRSRTIALTGEGRRLLADAVPLWQSVQYRLRPLLSAPDTTYSDLVTLARS